MDQKEKKIILTKHSIERYKERYSYKHFKESAEASMIKSIAWGIDNDKLLQSKDDKHIKYLRIGEKSYFTIDVSQLKSSNKVVVVTFATRASGWINFLFNKVKLY